MESKDLKDRTLFTMHHVYRRSQRWLELPAHAKATVANELSRLLEKYQEQVTARGIYSAVGFRPDTDVIFWLYAEDPDALQAWGSDLRHTTFGRAMDLSWAFWGMTRPPQFMGDHYPAFQLGQPPRRYLQLYPFVRTAEWYLMPREDRGRMLRAHGMMGKEFPEVQANTVQAFGLGDYEWVLSFETDRLENLVDLIRRLREAEARRYTQLDVPFILGARKDLDGVIQDLG